MNIKNTLLQASIKPALTKQQQEFHILYNAACQYINIISNEYNNSLWYSEPTYADLAQLQTVALASNIFFTKVNEFLKRQVHFIYVTKSGTITEFNVTQEKLIYKNTKLRDSKSKQGTRVSIPPQISKEGIKWVDARKDNIAKWYQQGLARFDEVESFISQILEKGKNSKDKYISFNKIYAHLNDVSSPKGNTMIRDAIVKDISQKSLSPRGFYQDKKPSGIGARFWYYNTYPLKSFGNKGFIAQGYVALINNKRNGSDSNFFTDQEDFLKQLANTNQIYPENNIALIGGDVKDADAKKPWLSYSVKSTDASIESIVQYIDLALDIIQRQSQFINEKNIRMALAQKIDAINVQTATIGLARDQTVSRLNDVLKQL